MSNKIIQITTEAVGWLVGCVLCWNINSKVQNADADGGFSKFESGVFFKKIGSFFVQISNTPNQHGQIFCRAISNYILYRTKNWPNRN